MSNLRYSLVLSLLLISFLLPTISNAQSGERVRNLQAEFLPEDGCPISVGDAKVVLDVDPFDAPIDARIYITYKNVSNTQVEAVKFRIRFVDNTGTDCGTFQASDAASLGIGQEHSQKWKREPVDPRTIAIKVRVLLVKYAGGNTWQSQKMPDSNVQ